MADALLQRYMDEHNEDILFDDWELTTLGEPMNLTNMTAPERITYAELQRPRVLLAFFVDIYRIAMELASSCRKSSKSKTLPQDVFVLPAHRSVARNILPISEGLEKGK